MDPNSIDLNTNIHSIDPINEVDVIDVSAKRVKPIPKPRKSLLVKRSNTVNFRPIESNRSESLKRSVSTDNLFSELMECLENEEECTCPNLNDSLDKHGNSGTDCNCALAISETSTLLDNQLDADEMSSLNFPTRQRLKVIDEQAPCSSNQMPILLNTFSNDFNEISLFEKIKRSKLNWHLPEICDRFAVCHLLGGSKEPGTFIVRSSSQPESFALSVKMHNDWPVDVEHYLIELMQDSVKLQGSPNSFCSLEDLILNYTLNGEEIQVRLQLPEAIRNARSFVDLENISTLGQGFWSEMSRPPSVYMNKTSNDPVALKMSQSMYGLAQKHHEDEHSAPEFQTEPRRRSTMRLGTNTFSSDYYSPTSQDHWNSYKKRPQMGVSSGLLKKSYSAYGIAAPPSDDETPIYSASRSLKARSRNPKTLLRNLFSNHDQSGDKKANKRENPIRQPRMITQSDYFMPQHLNGSTDSPYWTPQVPSDQSSFGESWQSSPEQKPRKPVERLLSASSVGRRLFRSSERKQCSKDDIGVQHRVDEAANHQVLRRQNTDLCASRLANFTPSNFVVEPPIRSKQGMPEHRRFHTGPIVPPHAGRMSTNSMQNCIEELRRKRGAGSTTSSKASSSRTEDDESEPSNDKTERPVVSLRNLDKPSNILNRDLNSRLSVPNLSASEQMSENSRIPVAKLGRSANTGELQIINEGLITPIVRRKYTNGNRQVVRIPPENATQVNYLPKHTRAASAEQATQQTQRQLAESLAAELNSLAARTKGRQVDQEARPSTFAAAQKSTIRTRPVNTAALNGTPAQTNSDDVPSFVHKHQPWNAVNRELKNRQLQIAKVKPQPVVRTRSTNQKPNSEFVRIAQKAMTKTPMTAEVKADESESTEVTHEASETFDTVPSSSFEESRTEQDDEDDIVSVAGTVFNEPWDNNALENLMDIAQFCDERPSKSKAKGAFIECCTHETIAEEDACSSMSGSISTASISPYSHVSRNAASPARNSNSDIEVHQESICQDDHEEDSIYGRPCSDLNNHHNDVLNLANNKVWNEMSKRIPSEPSTFDSRKDNRSRSMVNVASEHLMMSPMVERQTLRMHAQTPGVFNNATINDSLDSFNSILPATSPARLRTNDRNTLPDLRIQNYIEKLAIDSNSTFGASLQCFIECTIDSENTDPRLAIRNARQFITGIKNYLTNGDTMQEIIEQESSKLQSNEFLNIDAIFEAVLHKIVLVPIKRHVYHLFCRESIKNGSFETLTSNLSLIRTLSMEKLGFPSNVKSPDSKTIELMRKHIRKMQNHYSPLKKFESMLNALSLLIRPNCSATLLRADSSKKLPCTEVIRWFVYLLAKTTCVTCEIEVCYMWELLPTQLLTTGHVIYYLSTLFSAINILKNADSIERLRFVTERPKFTTPQATLQACIDEAADGYCRIAIPNENLGTIDFKIFPLVAQLNVQRLCQIIANQLSISNNEEYGLFVLFDGCETLLHANECPLTIRTDLNATGKAHFFAYKRTESKIAWPSSAVQLTSSTSLNQPVNATFGSIQSRYV